MRSVAAPRRAHVDEVALGVGEGPPGGCVLVRDEVAPGGDRRRDARLALFGRHPDIDVHQRVRRIQLLEPDRCPAAVRVDHVLGAVGAVLVTEDRTPERLHLGNVVRVDRELDGLHNGRVSGDAERASDRRDFPSQFDVALGHPHVVVPHRDEPHHRALVPQIDVRMVVVEAGQLANGCHEPGAGRERLGAEEGARSLAHDTPIFNAHRFVELPRRNLVLHALDIAWDYKDGRGEVRMGKALRDGYRERACLMTKIDGQTRTAAARQIEESLRRLQTDVIDLLQFHEIIRIEDPGRIFAEGGAIEAALEAKDAGRIRSVGFTGHKSPTIHLTMLETAANHGFRFDTVQMPLNVMDAHFESFERKVLPVLVKDGIGVLGMKPLGDRQIPTSKTVSAVDALHYAMNLPTSVVITGCDSMEILEQALHAARTFRPMSPDEVKALLAKTESAAHVGAFERYRTTADFDSTAAHPEWLG